MAVKQTKNSRHRELSKRMLAAVTDILTIIHGQYSHNLVPRLVDRYPVGATGLQTVDIWQNNVKLTDALRKKINSLQSVKLAAAYLDKNFPKRIKENAIHRGYAIPSQLDGKGEILLFIQDILSLGETKPVKGKINKALFDHVFQARYRSPILRYCVRPIYGVSLDNVSFKISKSLSLRQPTQNDRYVLSCNTYSNDPPAEALLVYEEPMDTPISNVQPELDALELSMHLLFYGDFCSYSTYQYASSGLLPYGHSGTISNHAISIHRNVHLHLDATRIKKIKQQYNAVAKFVEQSKFSISWGRFNESFRRGREGTISGDTDRFIDLCIAYEGLFSDDEDKQALNYKLAHRATITLMSRDKADREKEFRTLKKAYHVRSSLMHGNTVKHNNLKKSIIDVRRALARGYLYCIKRKLYAHDQWLAHCL